MGISFAEILLLPILMISSMTGGGNELLDYVDTDAYWTVKGIDPTAETLIAKLPATAKAPDISELAKKLGEADFNTRRDAFNQLAALGPAIVDQLKPLAQSDDAEVANAAQRLIEQLGKAGAAVKVMRLMAIRTLGEKKVEQAAPELKKLLGSTELFVADYAARALAAIEGREPVYEQLDAKRLTEDLNLLPENVGAVAQLRLRSGPKVNYRKLWLTLKDNPMLKQQGIDEKQMVEKATASVLQAVEMVGNVRLDSATVGVSSVLTDRSGFGIFVLRGQYDKPLLRSMLDRTTRRGLEVARVNDVEVLRPDNEAALVMQEGRMVFMGFDRRDSSPEQAVTAALKLGKGTLHKNAALARLVESADRTAPLWAVSTITESYREAPLLKPLDTVVAHIKPVKGKLVLSVTGQAAAAEKADISAKLMQGYLQQARQVAPMLQQMGMGSAVEMLNSLKVKQDGPKVELTGEASPESLPMMFMMVTFGRMMHGGVDFDAPVEAEPMQ